MRVAIVTILLLSCCTDGEEARPDATPYVDAPTSDACGPRPLAPVLNPAFTAQTATVPITEWEAFSRWAADLATWGECQARR